MSTLYDARVKTMVKVKVRIKATFKSGKKLVKIDKKFTKMCILLYCTTISINTTGVGNPDVMLKLMTLPMRH